MTRDEAVAIYHAGPEAVVKVLLYFDAEIKALRNRVKILEERLAKDSHNSSKPPSTDGFKKRVPRSLRKQSNRKSGGQKGHTGYALKMVETPEHTIDHHVNQCELCGKSLEKQPSQGTEKRQEFDIPPMKIFVTEHRADIKKCDGCGHVNKGVFPDRIKAAVQYGPRIKSIAAYLMNYQFLPYNRTKEFFRDIFGRGLSEGTLVNINNEISNLLENPVAQIREQISRASLAHFDETGCSLKGKQHWLHVASTPELTYYQIHKKRGSEAMDAIGILRDFTGRAIHDFWSAYLKYKCSHGFCNAHLLRELIFVHEQRNQVWAKEMIDYLLKVKEMAAQTREKESYGFLSAQIDEFETEYARILQKGYDENPLPPPKPTKRRGRPKKSDELNLLLRFKNYQREILAFMYDLNVPFDNNLSERDLRMMKNRQKISGTFRSNSGARAFCITRSYLSTVRKNSVNVIDAIHYAITGIPFIPSMSNLNKTT